MAWTTITKPSVGDPTKKTAFADAVIDNLAYLKAIADTVLSSTAILNGSFESDTDADSVPDSWTFTPYTGGTKTIDSTDQRHGQKAFKMTSPGGAGNGGGILESDDFFEVSPNRRYVISWQMKSDDAAVKNEVVLLWYKSDQTASTTPSTTVYSEATNNPTSWALCFGLVEPPSDARYAKLQLIGCKNDDVTAGSTWFDDVRMGEPEFTNSVTFNTSGTHTFHRPTGKNVFLGECIGGGAPGNNVTGGGGGEYAAGIFVTGSDITVAVGAASASTTINTTTIVAFYGTAGAAGGAGGTGGTGTVTIDGQAGGASAGGHGARGGAGGTGAGAGLAPGGGGGATSGAGSIGWAKILY